MCSFYGFSQNVSNKSISIKSNFSTESIKAYQESANLKLDDFYSYLSLYSDAKTSNEFRLEIKQNIFRLFGKKSFEIVDFLSDEEKQISIDDFLSKIESKNYGFATSHQFNSNVDFHSWECSYQLKIYFGNDFEVKNVKQNITFFPVEKAFGTNSKTVWNIYLGNFIN